MMCTTVLHGGVCHRTSTPHKSEIKMKVKKRRMELRARQVTHLIRATSNLSHCATTQPFLTRFPG